jgi:putative phosphoesterase
MRLGILSDSHDRIQRIRDALGLLEAHGVDAFVHCGDVGGPEAWEEFAGKRCWLVLGNTDAPCPSWKPQIQALGLPWPDGPLELCLAGKNLAVYHGHERRFEEAILSGRYDYVLHGHTHRRADFREGRTRVINPGALHRVTVPTVAILDLETDQVEFLPLEPPGEWCRSA